MVKKPQRPRRVRTCVYCGKSEEPKGERFTRDHVLPKSLFNVLDRQMITVLACSACQEEKRYGDDDLRDFVNLHYAGAQHPEAQEQLLKIAASTLGGHSKIGNAFWSTGQLRERFSEAGLYLGDVVEAPIPGNNRDMFKTLEYIVRGLYFHNLNTPLPPQSPVRAVHVNTERGRATLRELVKIPHRAPIIKGHMVAWIMSHHVTDDPLATAWTLVFNGGVYFFAVTDELARRMPEPQQSGSRSE